MQNEILGPAARLQEMLSRLFGTTAGAPAPQLSPEIVPIAVVVPPQPEDYFLRRELIWARTVDVTGDGTHAAAIRLRNPEGSNLIAVVDQIVFSNIGVTAQGSAVLGIGQGTADLVTGTTRGLQRDGRMNASSVCILSNSVSTAAASFAGHSLILVGATTSIVLSTELVIPPGSTLDIQGGDNAQRWIWSLRWRERPASVPELQP